MIRPGWRFARITTTVRLFLSAITFKSVGKRFTYGGDTDKDQVECAPFEAEAKFCKNCGAKIEEPTKPCPTCGKPLAYYGKGWRK